MGSCNCGRRGCSICYHTQLPECKVEESTKEAEIKPVSPDSSKLMTLKDLITLIGDKCDKTTCEAIQDAIGDTSAGGGIESKINKTDTFRVVDSEGREIDLSDKYPNAELVKTELTSIWDCVNDRMKFHGDWEDNTTKGKVLEEAGKCLMEDNEDKDIEIRIGVDAGDTVYDGLEVVKLVGEDTPVPVIGSDGTQNKVLWLSLTNNNKTKPTEHPEDWIAINYLKYAQCSNMSMWKFDNCDDLKNIDDNGIGVCPLKEGQIAMITPPNSECFDIYRYASVPANVDDPDGDECGIVIGTKGSNVYKWTSYADCHGADTFRANLQDFAVTVEPTDSYGSIDMFKTDQPFSTICDYSDPNTLVVKKAGMYIVECRIQTLTNGNNAHPVGVAVGSSGTDTAVDSTFLSKNNSGQAHTELYVVRRMKAGDTIDLFYSKNGTIPTVGTNYSGAYSAVTVTRVD